MKQLKSILYLRTDLTTQKIVAGGSVAHTLGVIGGFVKKGINVVCALSFMAEQVHALHPQDLKKLHMPRLLKLVPLRLRSCFSSFFFFFQTRKLIKKHKTIDAIYQRYSLLNCTGLLLAWWFKIPLILEFNGSEYWVDQNWASKKWFKLGFLVRWIERLNIHRADYIIVVSAVLKENLIHEGVRSEKILVNPNGVNTDYYDPAVLITSRKSIRSALHLNEKFVFGFVGTFSIWHGIDVLHEMIPNVIAKNSQVHFLLIGEGPLRKDLQHHLTKKDVDKYVTFTGMVPQHEARKYLAACDAFLSPTQPNKDGSRFFGSPTKLFEYMSMAKPIIASDLEQVAEVIQPASGILVKPKNIDGFVQAAVLLIDEDNKKRSEKGKYARSTVIKKYTWDAHVQRIIDFVS